MHARKQECDRDRGGLDRTSTNADASISTTTNTSSNENGKMNQTLESALCLLSAACESTDLLFCHVLLTFCTAPTHSGKRSNTRTLSDCIQPSSCQMYYAVLMI